MAAKAKSVSKPDKKNQSQQDDLSHLAKAIISNAGVGIYIVQHGKFVYVSSLYQKLTGYSDTELIGTYSLNNIYPDDREMVREEAIKCLKKERLEPYEYRFVNKKNEIMWVLDTITPIVYKEERATLGSFMDITERKKVEEKLHREEYLFRILAEQSLDGIVFVNRKGIITYENPAIERSLGFKAEERIGTSVFERIHPDDVKPVIDTAISLAKDTKAPGLRSEIRLCHKDGSWRTFEVTGTNLVNDKIIESGIINLHDITERKKAEEELRQSEEKYRTILETIQEAYFEVDIAGNFTFFNDSMCWLTGCSKEELLGMNHRQFTDEETSKQVFQAFNKVYNTGEPTKKFDWQVVRKDGTKRYIEASVSLQKDSSDKPIGFRGIIRDITERKQAEDVLRESEERYRTILETIQDGYLEMDLAGNIVFMNGMIYEHLGYSREELIGKNGRKFQDEANFKKVSKAYEEIYKTEKPNNAIEMECIRKDRTIGTYEASVSLARDANGKPIGFRSISRDITERKRSEELRRQSEEKYHLLAEHMTDTVWITDLNLKVTYISPSAEKLLGYTLDEIISIPLDKILTSASFKDAMDFFSIEMPKALAAPSDYILTHSLELEFCCKNGRTVWGECMFSLIQDDNGKPLSILGEARVITERKRLDDELQRSLESLRKSFGTIIQIMVSAVEMRDPYTAGHQIRSADLARSIAKEMGLSQDKMDGIRMAGSIHDIGKLSVPAEILSKPTKLTDIEFSIIKEHSKFGYEMLKDIDSPWPLAEIVYQHHERMNGSGYPRKLKGDEILLEARIMAVADVVEAMASHRPYRPGLGIEAALEEIEKNKGFLYDDAVADACLRLFRKKGYKLP